MLRKGRLDVKEMDPKWQVGLQVVVRSARRFSESRREFSVIKRVMKRWFELEDGSKWDSGGWPYPRSLYTYASVKIATPELLVEVCSAARRRELLARIRDARFDQLPTEKLEAIVAVLAGT